MLCHDDRRCLNGIRSGKEKGEAGIVQTKIRSMLFGESANEKMVNGMPKTHAAVSHMGKEQIKHPCLEKDGAASYLLQPRVQREGVS